MHDLGVWDIDPIVVTFSAQDRVDSIQYSHRGTRFISGSKDGTARVWRYERQNWVALVLRMSAET